jgi:VIT1/CCC1 family predicted Fe2+/Mn2+ transporter
MSARDSWTQENESVFLYGVLAAAETLPERRGLFEKLAREAQSQAAIWADELREQGITPPAYVASARVRIVALLVRRFGPERMRGVLSAMKVRGMSIYGVGVGKDGSPSGHAMPRSIHEVGRRHHHGVGADRSGNLRAAVFGANDGLVSNTSLILGVAGATADAHMITISGMAGLLAGAFSMAAGEYVSMRSQREMFERQIAAERDELARYPKEEAAELALIYEARGVDKHDAERVAKSIIANPESALETLAREELGLDPTQLGSPSGAALSSFWSFSLGAIIPLLPFLLYARSGRGARAAALPISMILSALALFGVGATMSLFSGRGAVRGGLRMLLIGGAAAAATFWIGRLFGVSVS